MKLNSCLVGFLAFGCATTAWSSCDQPDVLKLGGTGYHADGWFTLGASVHSDGDSLLFDNAAEFVLSPRYQSPIRKVVLSVRASSASATRTLWTRPLVDGVETSTNDFACVVPGVPTDFETVSFDFSPKDNVDAVRICVSSGGSGNWRIARMLVFYGSKDAQEDALLRELAQQLPTPENLRAADFTDRSLNVQVDAVTGAVGYRFSVCRLEGLPRTECREEFADLPRLSSGWTYGATNNVSLGVYTGTSSGSYPDHKTMTDGGRSLQIAAGKGAEDILVEILSPEVAAAVTEYSFVHKAASSGKSDRVTVYGRSSGTGEWQTLADPTNVLQSKAWTTNAVSSELDVRQLKFVFTARKDSYANASLDTLRLVYGGEVSRIPLAFGDIVANEPACSFANLEKDARYVCRVQAVGDAQSAAACRDSSWTEDLVVDLSWANLTVTAPEGVEWESNGSKMTVRWTAVAGADHYLVDVVPTDDVAHPVVTGAVAQGTSLDVTVPRVGEYAVTVTAVSPGGKSVAAATAVAGDVELASLGAVAARAVERQTIEASWDKVALAEGYQAKLVRIGGTAETLECGWVADGDGRCALPDGWTCHADWTDPRCANTWTSGEKVFPALPYAGCFLASCDRGQPLTKVSCAYKCGSTKADVLDCTRLVVSAKPAVGDWETVGTFVTSKSLETFKLNYAPERNVRLVRFSVETTSGFVVPSVRLGKVTLVSGVETRSEIASVRTTEASVSFRDLDPNGSYAVSVVPQPSEGDALGATSPIVNLAAEKFRTTGAVPLSGIRGGLFSEDFSALTNVTADTETRSIGLDYWQFCKGSGEPETILYTSGTNRTTGGVYVFGDEARTESSFMVGTLSTSTYGCSVGIAFLNDTASSVGVGALSFDAIQRNFRTVQKTYALEWLVTDGAAGIDSEGEWQPLEIPTVAPYVAGDAEAQGEFRQAVTVTQGLPPRIPAGGVLIVRWRHEKGSSGPMMAIDNVRLELPDMKTGTTVILR